MKDSITNLNIQNSRRNVYIHVTKKSKSLASEEQIEQIFPTTLKVAEIGYINSSIREGIREGYLVIPKPSGVI